VLTRPVARRPLLYRLTERSGHDRRGPHYGWWIVVGVVMIMFVGVGVGYYALAVFLRPLQEENGWSNAAVSGATGMYFSVSGITAAIFGPRIDRTGPIGLMLIGTVGMAAAIAAVGSVSELWHLYAAYAVLAVSFGMALGTGTSSIMSRWFVTRRAQAMSIAFIGPSLGGMVLVPLGTALISAGGLGLAGPGLALVALVVGIPFIVGVLIWDPQQVDAEVDFGRPLDVANTALGDDVQHRLWSRAEAVRTVAFWSLLVGFALVLCAQTGFIIHQLAFLEDRFGSASAASFALTVTAFGSIIARLVVGIFGDRINRRLLTVALFAVQGLSVLGVTLIDNTVLTWVLVLVIGFTIGNVYMMQTLLVSDVFGQVSFATIMGLIGVVTGIGTGFGPLIVGWVEDVTGSYRVPFFVTTAMTMLAAVVVSQARPPRPPAAAADAR